MIFSRSVARVNRLVRRKGDLRKTYENLYNSYDFGIPALARAIQQKLWKSVSKCIRNAIEKAMRSGSEFSLIWLALGTLLGTFWHPDGPQKVPKTPLSEARNLPKSAQEAPKTA